MPLIRRNNQRVFHRRLHGGTGALQTVTLLKRNDDQQEGIVTALILYQCRRSIITKTGEPLAGDMASGDWCVWHFPRTELDRVGVNYINAIDRIVDTQYGFGTWQPESTTSIEVKLFAVHVDVFCRRVK